MADEAASPFARTLEAWSRANAWGTLLALALAAALGAPWPLVPWAALSFASLLFRSRAAFTPSGSFGAANALTLARLVAMLAALSLLHGREMPFGATAIAVFALDGVDGWIARRTGQVSRFGAHLDMETDALFVLALGVELWQGRRLGPWILTGGMLRYFYVLAISLVPPPLGEVPRSRSGRHGFVVLVIGLLSGLLLPLPAGACLAALGTAVAALSFARSFYVSYAAATPRRLRS
jgi:phosphatidylglycerophosphate synthase